MQFLHREREKKNMEQHGWAYVIEESADVQLHLLHMGQPQALMFVC